jgi:hypothetical protein
MRLKLDGLPVNVTVTLQVSRVFSHKTKKSRGLSFSAITGQLVWETQHDRRKLQLHSLHGYAINRGNGRLLSDSQSTLMVRLQRNGLLPTLQVYVLNSGIAL